MEEIEEIEYPVIQPNLQISFYSRLKTIGKLYLSEGLKLALTKVKISDVRS